MATAAKEKETNQLFNLVWETWESGVKKVYDSQQEFGKASLEALKKQQDLFTSMTTNLNKVEAELKGSVDKITQTFKENSKDVNNKDVAQLLENWNDKVNNAINRILQLSATPSKSLLNIVEQSQEKMYETLKNAVEEQNKVQTETREVIESFMSHVKESQGKLVEIMEAQTKQTFEKLQPK